MRTVSRHTGFYDLLDAMGQPGCPLCSLAARTRWRYLDSLAYENVNDPGVREKLRASLGFCNRHAWYFVERVREVFGTAIIYRDVLHAVQRRAADHSSADPFVPSGVCVACMAERDVTDAALNTLAEAIDEPDLRAAFVASEGLCAPHLRRALTLTSGEIRGKLFELTAETWQEAPDDVKRARWRATGTAGTFGPDDLALTSDAAASDPPPLPSTEPFVCAVCAAIRAGLDHGHTGPSLDGANGGICNVHARRTPGADVLDLCHRQVAATLAQSRDLAQAPGESRVTQAMRNLGLVRPPADLPVYLLSCVVCARQAAVETSLCAHAEGPLCLPHLRRALRRRGGAVVGQVRQTWHELDHLLHEYLRKEDYRFRDEPRGSEQSSPRWAVALIAGAPGLR